MSLESLTPASVSATRTRRRRLDTVRSMVMYPASSSVVNCFERAESDISSRSLTKENSAQSVDASKATIDSRVLGWMSSSKRGVAMSADT